MITEDYVNFEIAKLLKEKGFDSEECFAFYKEDGEMGFLQTFGDIADYNSETCVLAPTLQMAMKWLREKHKINITIGYTYKADANFTDDYVSYCFEVENAKTLIYYTQNEWYSTYEKACETAIKYCLENLV